MTDQDILYKQIIDDPLDNDARSRYADYLIRNDIDPEHGEYIHLQLELHELIETGGRRKPFSAPIVRCEEILTYRNANRWIGRTPVSGENYSAGPYDLTIRQSNGATDQYYEFRRGFPEFISLHWMTWVLSNEKWFWYPGQMTSCEHWPEYRGICAKCRGRGFVPVEFTSTVHPLREVDLTTRPNLMPGCRPPGVHFDEWIFMVAGQDVRIASPSDSLPFILDRSITVMLIEARWPGIKFKIP